MIPVARWLTVSVLLAVAFTTLPSAVAAQQDTLEIRGRVLGPDNSGVAGQRVLLHRVAGMEGANIAETTTSEDGAFVLRAESLGDTVGVYFVATRYEGELYIAPAFRAIDVAGGLTQDLQVGVPGTSATALLEGAGQGAAPIAMGRPATSRNWLLLIIPLLGVAAMALYALVPRTRMAPDRALLIRIAELDERMMTAPAGQRENLAEERARLVLQLRAEGG
jgi:hypothetical protein